MLIIGIVAGGIYLHYTSILRENRDLAQAVGQLQEAVATQAVAIEDATSAIGEWDETLSEYQSTTEAIGEVRQEAARNGKLIEQIFATRDIEAEALEDPTAAAGTANRIALGNRSLLNCITAGEPDCGGGDIRPTTGEPTTAKPGSDPAETSGVAGDDTRDPPGG